MSPELYAWLLGAIGLGAAVAGWTASPDAAPRRWPSLLGLGGLIAALLAVGIVSGTVMRHVIQLSPVFVAVGLVAAGSSYGRAATLPILMFWGALMLTIWRFLLGWTRIIGGHFTAGEIALTVGVAAACVAGLAGGARPTANLPVQRRVAAALAFGLLQLAALWVSMRPLPFLR
jgi:hypothetical protein